MNSHRRGVLLGIIGLLVLAACGSDQQSATPTAPGSARVQPSPSVEPTSSAVESPPEATPQPTPGLPTVTTATFSLLPADTPPDHKPGISCSGTIGPNDPVALVHLRSDPAEAEPIVLRDYADPANPGTVCELTGGDFSESVEQLVDARHIVVENCNGRDGCLHAVVDLPEVEYHWFDVPGEFIAVSPDLDEVAWVRGDSDGTHRRLVLTTSDGDHPGARFLPVGGRCGTGDDSKRGAYGRGDYFYALDVPMPQGTVFVGYRGLEQVFSQRPPTGGWTWPDQPAMPVWDPMDDVLYYRLDGSVWRWTPEGGDELFLDGVHWQFPSFSPDGRYLTYAVPQDDGTHDSYLLDMRSGRAPKLIGERRTQPVFLTDTQLWWKSEKGGGCVTEPQVDYIYDVNEAAEARSIISSVRFVWPGTSSNS